MYAVGAGNVRGNGCSPAWNAIVAEMRQYPARMTQPCVARIMNLLNFPRGIQERVLSCTLVTFRDDRTHGLAPWPLAAMLNGGQHPGLATVRSGRVNGRSPDNQAARGPLKTTGDINRRCAR